MKRERLLIWIGVVLLVAALLATLFLWDPFDFSIIDRITGRYDAATDAIPADALLYISTDLEQLSEDELNRILKPFLIRREDIETKDYDSALDSVDDQLSNLYGVTIQDDVFPWLGPRIGLALVRHEVNTLIGESKPGWLLALTSRDKTAADDFMEKLAFALARKTSVSEDDYQGSAIFLAESVPHAGQLAFGRSGSVVLIASHESVIRHAIDAQRSRAIADISEYATLIAELGEDNAVTLYADPGKVGEVAAFSGVLPFGIEPAIVLATLNPVAASINLADDGLDINIVSLLPAETAAGSMADDQDQDGMNQLPDTIPADTVLYFGGHDLRGTWDSLIGNLPDDARQDVDEVANLFSKQFGFSLEDDLIELFSGYWAVGLRSVTVGGASRETGAEGQLVALFEVDDSSAVAGTIDSFNAALKRILIIPESAANGQQLYRSDLSPLGFAPILYGLIDGRFILSTGEAVLLAKDGNLESLSEQWEREGTWSEFFPGNEPLLYARVDELLSNLLVDGNLQSDELDLYNMLMAVTRVAAAKGSDAGFNYVKMKILIEGMN